MRYRMTRRLAIWTVAPLILAHIGCAARGVQVSPSKGTGAENISDQPTCEARAKAEAAKVEGRSVVGAGFGESLHVLAAGSSGGLPGLVIGALLMPVAAVWGPVEAANENAKRRQAVYDAAMTACSAPKAPAPEELPEEGDAPAEQPLAVTS
jgi:hypothetical protein